MTAAHNYCPSTHYVQDLMLNSVSAFSFSISKLKYRKIEEIVLGCTADTW